MPRTYLTLLHAPWIDENDDIQYSNLTVKQAPKVKQQKAKHIVRKFYAGIGLGMTDRLFNSIWKSRYETPVMDEDSINKMLTEMAIQSYEEAKKDSALEDAGDTSKETT